MATPPGRGREAAGGHARSRVELKNVRLPADDAQWHPAFAEWRAAVASSVRVWDAALARPFYTLRELWARSYAQTILLRCVDPGLEAHLTDLPHARDAFVWQRDQFEPIAKAVAGVFARFELSPARFSA
jgi:hypothetical protein